MAPSTLCSISVLILLIMASTFIAQITPVSADLKMRKLDLMPSPPPPPRPGLPNQPRNFVLLLSRQRQHFERMFLRVQHLVLEKGFLEKSQLANVVATIAASKGCFMCQLGLRETIKKKHINNAACSPNYNSCLLPRID